MLAVGQPGSAEPAGGVAPSPQGPTEAVTRPAPGLARGRWEAPPWAFWVALAVVVIGVTLYVLRRMGILKLKREPRADAPPTSKRGGRP